MSHILYMVQELENEEFRIQQQEEEDYLEMVDDFGKLSPYDKVDDDFDDGWFVSCRKTNRKPNRLRFENLGKT